MGRGIRQRSQMQDTYPRESSQTKKKIEARGKSKGALMRADFGEEGNRSGGKDLRSASIIGHENFTPSPQANGRRNNNIS